MALRPKKAPGRGDTPHRRARRRRVDLNLDNGAVISLIFIYGSRLVRRGSYAVIVRNG